MLQNKLKLFFSLLSICIIAIYGCTAEVHAKQEEQQHLHHSHKYDASISGSSSSGSSGSRRLAGVEVDYGGKPQPVSVNVAFAYASLLPKLSSTDPDVLDPVGSQYLAAFLMAIEDLNNKTDGHYDDLLPKTKIKVVVGDTNVGDFLGHINRAIYYCTDSFANKGIIGAVGSSNNEASSAIAQIFNSFHINQVAYGSTGSFLSYVGPYPYYFRTCSDDAFQGYAIADIIYYHYQWETVSTFSSTDTFGTDGFLQFSLRAQQLGVNILSTHQFRPRTSDFTSLIESAKSYGTRIFFFFMSSADAAVLIEQGYELGLFTQDTQIIGNSEILSPTTWQSMSANANIPAIMNGVLALQQSLVYNNSRINNFYKRFRERDASVIIDPTTKSETCVDTLDDDSNYFLYKKKLNNDNAYTCSGLDFTTFGEDGTGVAPFVPFAYDAVIALAQGLHNVFYSSDYNDAYDKAIHGDFGDYLGGVMGGSQFLTTGLTGDIKFRLGDATGFGYGDRELGISFDLNNFRPDLYCPIGKQGGVASIGRWSLDGYVHCDEINDASCIPTYNTGDNMPPLDKPMPIIVPVAAGVKAFLIAIGVISLLFVLACALMIHLNRHNKLVKCFQPMMLYICAGGGVLASIRIIIGSQDMTDGACIAVTWFGHLSFFVAFTALLVKLWRVHTIVNTTAFKRSRITSRHVFLITSGIILLVVIYLIIYTAIGVPHSRFYTISLQQLKSNLQYECTDDYPQFATTLYIVELLFLVYGGYLCYKTMHVPDGVNDSKSIAMSMYAMMFVICIVFPIIFLLNMDPNTKNIISALGFFLGLVSAMFFIFMPKALLLYQGAILDSKMNLIIPEKKAKNGKISAVAENVNQLDSKLLTSNDELPDIFVNGKIDVHSKSKREQNIVISKVQVKKWQAVLTQLETMMLYDNSQNSGTNSQSKRSQSSIQASIAEVGGAGADANGTGDGEDLAMKSMMELP